MLMRLFTPLNPLMYRLFGARMRVQRRPVLLLTTVGARTGRRRQTMVVWFPDPRGDLVVASNAGATRHPSWFFNLARHPGSVWVQKADRTMKVRPELLRGAERAAAWQQIVTMSPVFASYATKTDREIPVVRLVEES
jgi:deazaflavin-dependent oxidoreductase (nitroreductase family)